MRGGQASRIQRPFQDPAVAFGAVAAALQEGIQLCRGSVLPEDAEGGRGARALHQRLHPGDRLLESIAVRGRSEEHTSELQSRGHLVCRLLLEKKKDDEKDRETQRMNYS